MTDRLTVVYTAANAPEAHLLQEQLAEAGIAATLLNESLQGAAGEVPLGWASAVRVAVVEEDAAEARRLAEAFDTHKDGRELVSAAPTEESVRVLSAWPSCPHCNKPRVAICPICRTSGHSFPPADPPPGESGESAAPVWLCPECDEPIERQFLRHCEWCHHDFGSGIQPPTQKAFERLSAREIALALAIAAVLAAIALYFALIV